MILNTRPLDWKSSALTTRSLYGLENLSSYNTHTIVFKCKNKISIMMLVLAL